jgi:hypothetical protein
VAGLVELAVAEQSKHEARVAAQDEKKIFCDTKKEKATGSLKMVHVLTRGLQARAMERLRE